MLAISSIQLTFEGGQGNCVVENSRSQLRGGQSKDARWEAMSMWLTQKSAAKGIWRYMCFGLRALLCSSRSTLYSITTRGREEKGRPSLGSLLSNPMDATLPKSPRPTAPSHDNSRCTCLSQESYGVLWGRLPLRSKLLVMARFVSIL
ncbi:hypothetical protein J3F84DRAFT_361547 [Trichoderma pleuroticola]